MSRSIVWRFAAALPCAVFLTQCGSASAPVTCPDANGCGAILGSGGSGGVMSTVAGAGSNAPAATAGAAALAGTMSSRGTAGIAGATTTAGTAAVAPASTAGATASTAGAAGSVAPMGGSTATAGGSAVGGASGMSGAAGTAGAPATAGTAAPNVGVDHDGVPLAKPGDSKTGSRQYLNLGDFRLLVNKWGSDELGCNTTMKVFVNTDKSFGWSFDRGGCGGNKQKPDYPEIEFGIHPFGAGNKLATTPSFSSTTVLPLQIKDIMNATVAVDGLNASIQKGTTWNVDVEFWLSQKNPVTDANPGVYAEVIAFWSWQDDWACDKSGSVTSGDKSYNLCHQDDNWGNGQWRYFQFRANGGPFQAYSGKVDVKAFLDWLVNTRGYSKDLWLTRIEVGSELDDNTAGTVNLKSLTFQVNAESRSAQFGQ